MSQQTQQINITYETLFDILRVEKGRDDIQELSLTFFQDVVNYLKQKKDLLKKKEHESGIDNYDEIKKMQIQYENIQKIIKEICERREKKILKIALNSSRTRTKISVENLLPEELVFYFEMKRVLDDNREKIITNLLSGNIPVNQDSMEKTIISQVLEEEKAESKEIIHEILKQESKFIKIRFLKSTEGFIGPELETYGPFEADAVATIPRKIAEILIENSSAEEDNS